MNTLLDSLRKYVSSVLQARSAIHERLCTNHRKCMCTEKDMDTAWLRQGGFNVVFADAVDNQFVARFSFEIFETRKTPDARKEWTHSMYHKGIGSCCDMQYQEVTYENTQKLKTFFKTLVAGTKVSNLTEECKKYLLDDCEELRIKVSLVLRKFITREHDMPYKEHFISYIYFIAKPNVH
eukprot:g72997.t1